MAEARGNPPSIPLYFCHQCNVNIQSVQEDFTCSTCGSGFIEEVTETSSHNAASQAGAGLGNFMEALAGGNQGFNFMDLFGMGNQPRRDRSQGQEGQGMNGVPGQSGSGGLNFGPFGLTSTSMGPGLVQFNFGGSSGQGGSGRSAAQGVGQANTAENPVEHMLQSFLSDLIHGLGGEQGQLGHLGGNFGDYVWGRDGLDAIVTQLMNQMEGSGPPPLPTDKLEQLPTVNITQEQVDRKLQCSVCWDNFQLSEEVKQLDCEHVYHPDCILPWLKLHGTCPICRRDFTGGKKDGEDSSSPTTTEAGGSTSTSSGPNPNPRRPAQTPGPGPSLPTDFLNLFNIPARSTSSAAAQTPNPNASTQSQAGQDQQRTGSSRNPSGPPPNLDMDMEFD